MAPPTFPQGQGTVLVRGGSVKWTAYKTKHVRFYVHVPDRKVVCGTVGRRAPTDDAATAVRSKLRQIGYEVDGAEASLSQ